MKLASFILATCYAEKKLKLDSDLAVEKVSEHEIGGSNWLDADFDRNWEDEAEDDENDESDYVVNALDGDNWLDPDLNNNWEEEANEDDEEYEEENATVTDYGASNWLDIDWNEDESEEPPAQFTWHGEPDLATVETCCGEPTHSVHSIDHPIFSSLLPKTKGKLVQYRSEDKLFDDSNWTTWKSFQPGNPQYSVTVTFKDPIEFRELRVVPNPIPFGVSWYNKDLQGLCVYLDDVEIECTPDDFELPAEPRPSDYGKAGHNSPVFKHDLKMWEKKRENFVISFESDGLVGQKITLMTRVGSEASFGDLKILYDTVESVQNSDSLGKYSKQHRLIEPEVDH